MCEVIETAKIRMKVVGSGKEDDPFRVNLPTYNMTQGTEEYADAEKKILKSVEVEIPDDEVDAQGFPDKAKIRSKYKGQPMWDHDGVLSDV